MLLRHQASSLGSCVCKTGPPRFHRAHTVSGVRSRLAAAGKRAGTPGGCGNSKAVKIASYAGEREPATTSGEQQQYRYPPRGQNWGNGRSPPEMNPTGGTPTTRGPVQAAVWVETSATPTPSPSTPRPPGESAQSARGGVASSSRPETPAPPRPPPRSPQPAEERRGSDAAQPSSQGPWRYAESGPGEGRQAGGELGGSPARSSDFGGGRAGWNGTTTGVRGGGGRGGLPVDPREASGARSEARGSGYPREGGAGVSGGRSSAAQDLYRESDRRSGEGQWEEEEAGPSGRGAARFLNPFKNGGRFWRGGSGRAPDQGLWGRKGPQQSKSQNGYEDDDWAPTPAPMEVEDGWGRPSPPQQSSGSQAQSSEASGRALESRLGMGEAQSQSLGSSGRQSSAEQAEPVSSAGPQPTGFTMPDFPGQPGSTSGGEDEGYRGGGYAGGEDVPDWEAEEEDWGDDEQLPDITPLAADEASEVLPLYPSSEQMAVAWGGAIDFGQRCAIALVLTIVVSQSNLMLLATGSATSVFWAPIAQAVYRNWNVRQYGSNVGFWRATVMEVRVERPGRQRYGERPSYAPVPGKPSIHMLVGDDSGARSLLSLPLGAGYEMIQVGEPAEVLVLSPQPGFLSFKAIKEVYLPESGIWLADYPHVNRNLFLEISLDIERERKALMAEGALEMPVAE